MNIGNAIKSVRTHYGISQEELSEKTGISQTSISQIENGIKQPSKRSILKICNAFEIPEAILYIIGIEDTDVPASRKKMFEKLYPDIKDIAVQILGKRNTTLLR